MNYNKETGKLTISLTVGVDELESYQDALIAATDALAIMEEMHGSSSMLESRVCRINEILRKVIPSTEQISSIWPD